MGRPPVSAEKRFWAKVNKDGPIHPVLGTRCWLWLGKLDKSGYGTFHVTRVNNRPIRKKAHNFLISPPDGRVPDHLCRNKACVNPDHLEHVTGRENILRGEGLAAKNAVKISCKNGHPFDEKNTRHSLDNGKARRTCRACARARVKKWNRKNKSRVKAYDRKRYELGLTTAQRRKS
jgi:HNH endonuclease